MNNVGRVDYEDVSMLEVLIDDPSNGGEIAQELGEEWYNLTGDRALSEDDLAELLWGILNTAPGDINLDGMVDEGDLADFEIGFGDEFDDRDFLTWQRDFGFNNVAPVVAAAPEPTAWALIIACVGGAALLRRRAH